jgi:hypothetical protein
MHISNKLVTFEQKDRMSLKITLAIMHDSTSRENGREQILGLASALRNLIGHADR